MGPDLEEEGWAHSILVSQLLLECPNTCPPSPFSKRLWNNTQDRHVPTGKGREQLN